MRYAIGCSLAVLIASTLTLSGADDDVRTVETVGRFTQPAESSESLIDLLTSQKHLAFTTHKTSGTYEIQLLSDELLQESSTYYENRRDYLAKSRELREQIRNLQRKEAVGRVRNARGIPVVPDLRDTPEESDKRLQLEEELRKFSRPTGSFRVAQVMRYGKDFIGLQELGTSREILVPIHQVRHVLTK